MHIAGLRYSAAAIREPTWSLSSAGAHQPSAPRLFPLVSPLQAVRSLPQASRPRASIPPSSASFSLARTPQYGGHHHTRPAPVHRDTPAPHSAPHSVPRPHALASPPQPCWNPPTTLTTRTTSNHRVVDCYVFEHAANFANERRAKGMAKGMAMGRQQVKKAADLSRVRSQHSAKWKRHRTATVHDFRFQRVQSKLIQNSEVHGLCAALEEARDITQQVKR